MRSADGERFPQLAGHGQPPTARHQAPGQAKCSLRAKSKCSPNRWHRLAPGIDANGPKLFLSQQTANRLFVLGAGCGIPSPLFILKRLEGGGGIRYFLLQSSARCPAGLTFATSSAQPFACIVFAHHSPCCRKCLTNFPSLNADDHRTGAR